ncbi:MAG: creatininase family protein [Candidatus Thermoplasmatota archaeon]
MANGAGRFLADLTWSEAERLLTPERVVLLPLGASAKEHGHHLRLDNDARLADHLARAVAAASDVVVLPTLGYHHYPAFAVYPGSTSLRPETARDLVVDIVRSIAAYGPRRFYILNTGISTVGPLADAATRLATDGVTMRWTDWKALLAPLETQFCSQPRGSHADEAETSLMLHLEPSRVEMKAAARELAEWKPGGFQRDATKPGTFSPSGVWGDATLATAEKGRALFEGIVAGLLSDVAALRNAPN